MKKRKITAIFSTFVLMAAMLMGCNTQNETVPEQTTMPQAEELALAVAMNSSSEDFPVINAEDINAALTVLEGNELPASIDPAAFSFSGYLKSMQEEDAIGTRLEDEDLYSTIGHVYEVTTTEPDVTVHAIYCGELLAKVEITRSINSETCWLSMVEYTGDEIYAVYLQQVDSNGDTIVDSTYTPDGIQLNYTESEYDTDGNCVSSCTYAADGTVSEIRQYECYEDGDLKSSSLYTADGTLINMSLFDSDGYCTYTGYNTDGTVSFDRTESSSGTVFKYYKDGAMTSYTMQDEQGNLLESFGHDGTGLEIHTVYENTYDSDGKLVSQHMEQSYGNNGSSQITDETYEYDTNGLLIKSTTVYINGAGKTTEYLYNKIGLLTEENTSDSNNWISSTRCKYTNSGNLISRGDYDINMTVYYEWHPWKIFSFEKEEYLSRKEEYDSAILDFFPDYTPRDIGTEEPVYDSEKDFILVSGGKSDASTGYNWTTVSISEAERLGSVFTDDRDKLLELNEYLSHL